MSVWDDRFQDHGVHHALAEAKALVRKVKIPKKAVEAAEARQRLDRVLEHIEAVLASADPQLVAPAVLDAIEAQVAPLRTQVEYAEGEEDPDFLNTANDYADAMLQAASGVTRLVASDDVERLQESATNFRQSAGQLLRHVREDSEELGGEIEGLRSNVGELREEVDTQKGRLDQALLDYQEQFTADQGERTKTFGASQEEHAAVLRDAISGAETRLDELVTAAGERTEQLGTDLRGRADAVLARLSSLEADAKRLVDVIGVTGMSGGYQQVADKEEAAADRWRWFAAGAAGLAVLLNLALILADVAGWIEEDFDWDRQVPRVLVTLSLLAFASYAGVESSRHRRRQEVNRQMEKELASLEPYLALFSDREKKDVKKAKFDLFFQGRKAHTVAEQPLAPNETIEPDSAQRPE